MLQMETVTIKGLTETENKSGELKHLGLLRMAAIQAVVCASYLYDYAKQNSGPLRSTVGKVEGAVTTVVGPVYEKFKGVPDDLLVFLDNKVDEVTKKFDKHAPPIVKRVASQGHCLIQKASENAQQLVNEARTGGPRAAINHAATETKHFAITQSVNVWIKLNEYPLAHKVSEVALPHAAQLPYKYNHFIEDMTQKGYAVFGYLPLVPIDEIATAFKQGEEAGVTEDGK